MVGVVPSLDFAPSSESSKFLPTLEEPNSPTTSQPRRDRMKHRAMTPDFNEFDAFALDTMEDDSTPRGGSPVMSHSTPASYSRMMHDGVNWDEDVNADNIHPAYTNTVLPAYSEVQGPQYRNMSAAWRQGSRDARQRERTSKSQRRVSTYDNGRGRHYGDHNLSDSDQSDHSQEGHHRVHFEEVSIAIHHQHDVDVEGELGAAHTHTGVSKSEVLHINAETGELSPVYSGGQLSHSEGNQGQLGAGSHSEGRAQDKSSGHTSPQPRGARPIPQIQSRPADNPLYASSPPNSNLMPGVDSPAPSRSAPSRSPKPIPRPKPVVNPTSSNHPSRSVRPQSAKQSQRGGQPPTSGRPLQDQDTNSPPKGAKPTVPPHPPPEKIQMKMTGNVAESGSHSQAKLTASRSAGSLGKERHKKTSIGDLQAPPPGTRQPPQPLPKPTRTIYH